MNVRGQLKENPFLLTVTAVLGLFTLANITTVLGSVHYVDTYLDSLATKEYVGGMLAVERRLAVDELAHNSDISDKKFRDMNGKIDRIRAFTEIVPQLRNLLTLRCMGTRGLDDVIVRLEGEYATLTAEVYVEQACDRLLAVR